MASGFRQDYKFRRQFVPRYQNGMHNKKVLTNTKTGAKVVVHNRNMHDAKIRQNLQPLQQHAAKKKIAQEIYYNKGRSPLVQTSSGYFAKQDIRGPVTQRLGNNGPKPWRHKTLQSDHVNPPRHLRKQNNRIRAISSTGKVVYLRSMQQTKVNPAKLTVCVDNDRSRYNNKHRVNTGLNPVLQHEIRLIQNKQRPVVLDMFKLTEGFGEGKLPIVTTGTTLNERFSMI